MHAVRGMLIACLVSYASFACNVAPSPQSYRESVPKFMTHANSDTRSTTSDNLILRVSNGGM